MTTRSSKYNLENFHELLVLTIIKHDFSFNIMDYVGIGPLFFYVYDEAKLITRNTFKAYFEYVYKREGETCELVELRS